MLLEGLTGLKKKVMELNPNFIQQQVESLLTRFVDCLTRGGNTDTPMMLDFCYFTNLHLFQISLVLSNKIPSVLKLASGSLWKNAWRTLHQSA